MTFKKAILSSAVAVALGSVASGAFAADFARTGATGTEMYSYNVETVGANSVYNYMLGATAPADGNLTAVGDTGGADGIRVRFTLSTGTWGAAVPVGFLSKGNCAKAGATFIVAGGTTSDNSVTFAVPNSANAAPICANNEKLDLKFKSFPVTVKNPSALGTVGGKLQMTIEFLDNGNNVILPTQVMDLTAASTAGSTFGFTGAADSTTDAQLANTKFVGGGATAVLGVVNFAAAGKALDTNNSFAFTASDRFTVTVNGDFSAAAATNGVFYDADNSGTFNAGDVAFTVSGNTATGSIPISTVATGKNIVYVTNGTSVISTPVTYSAAGTVNYSNLAYKVPSVSAVPTLSKILSNGVTAIVSFLNPKAEEANSGYVSVIRVTNADSVAGDVYFTLYNDDGTKSASTKIGNVPAGGSKLWLSSELETLTGTAIPAGAKGRGIINLNARKGFAMVWNMNTANKTLTSQGPVATQTGGAVQ